MTVTATIEIGTSEALTPSLGKALGAAHGVGRVGDLSTSPTPGAESFRAGWQSLLASINSSAISSSVSASSKSQSEADQAATAEAATGEAARKPSVATQVSSQTALAALRLRQATEEGSEESSAVAKLTLAGAQRAASTGTVEKKTVAAPESESAGDSRSAHSAAKQEAVAAEAAPAVAPEAVASLTQSVPLASLVVPAAETKTQFAQSDLSTALSPNLLTDPPTGFASASWSSHPLGSDRPNRVAERANSAVQVRSDESDTPAKQGQLSSQIEVPAEGGKLLEAPAQERKLTQTAALSQNSTETLRSSQAAPQNLLLNQNPSPEVASGQKPIPAFTQNQGAVSMQPGSQGMEVVATSTASAAVQSGLLPDAVPMESKSGSTGGGKSATPGKEQSARKAGNVDSIPQMGQLSLGSAVEPSAMTRGLATVQGVVSAPAAPAGASTAATSGSTPSETFAALDAEGAAGRPTWVHAGAQRAEAGYQDPALGWVGVRAETSGGGVHAELVPGSADAAQTLGGHLAGLNAYLAEHHAPVETVTMSAPEGGWGGSSSGKDAEQNMQQGVGQQAGQGTGQSGDAGTQSSSSSASTTLTAAASSLQALPGGLDGSAQAAWPAGAHISVMA